jgi:hypothetical protein
MVPSECLAISTEVSSRIFKYGLIPVFLFTCETTLDLLSVHLETIQESRTTKGIQMVIHVFSYELLVRLMCFFPNAKMKHSRNHP